MQVADSEDHCSVSATPVSPGEELTNGSAAKRLSNCPTAFSLITMPKVEKEEANGEDDIEVSARVIDTECLSSLGGFPVLPYR